MVGLSIRHGFVSGFSRQSIAPSQISTFSSSPVRCILALKSLDHTPHEDMEDSEDYHPMLRSISHSLHPPAEVPAQVSSAIETASPHPRSKILESELKKRYDDVMNHPIYAKDIDPENRGPFGNAKIELKDGAKPMHTLLRRT